MFAKSLITVAAVGGVLLTSTPALASDKGLYGKGDPTYDAVYRQSFSILALKATGRDVPRSAVRWLLDQQCRDGGYQAYRADTGAACQPANAEQLTGQELNSTALAVAALHHTGNKAQARKAAKWIASKRNSDGGYSYYPEPGAASDSASTALAVAAQELVGRAASTSYLRKLQKGCEAPRTQRGGLPFDGSLPEVNDGATGQAAYMLGGGMTLPDSPRRLQRRAPGLVCKGSGSTPVTQAARGYLDARLRDQKGALPYGGGYPGTDTSGTASAVLALAQAGVGRAAVEAGTRYLDRNAKDWVTAAGDDAPASLALLMLVADATGNDVKDFGGMNLVKRLAASQQ